MLFALIPSGYALLQDGHVDFRKIPGSKEMEWLEAGLWWPFPL